jgi:hypothetical protein
MIATKVALNVSGGKDPETTAISKVTRDYLLCDLCYAHIKDTPDNPLYTKHSFANDTLTQMLKDAYTHDLCEACYQRLLEESKFYTHLYINQLSFMMQSLEQRRPVTSATNTFTDKDNNLIAVPRRPKTRWDNMIIAVDLAGPNDTFENTLTKKEQDG